MIVKAKRWPPGATGDETPAAVEVEVEVRPGFDGEPWLYVTRGGPTGYESMHLADYRGQGWSACAGCGNYARLFIPHEEMLRVIDAAGVPLTREGG
jgi:hypothetical protein